MNKTLFTFEEYNKNIPCDECSAPCCRYLIVPYKTPSSWMDLDFVRYLLNFPDVNITVSKNGTWGILINQNCVHLDEKKTKCKVHKTSKQPKTCSYYNPYQCNYRINIDTKKPASIYVLTRENFDQWAQYLKFDENGILIDAPSYEKSIEILDNSKNNKKETEDTSDPSNPSDAGNLD